MIKNYSNYYPDDEESMGIQEFNEKWLSDVFNYEEWLKHVKFLWPRI